MTGNKKNIKPDELIDIAIRKRWIMIIPLGLSLIVGIYLAITLPRIYQSRTLILIQPQKVPQNYVQSLVSADIESRISTISQQIMSRSNLEKIIEQFDLFIDSDESKLYLEEKIALIRKNIAVKVTRAQGDVADAFSLSFKGKEPTKVMQVANALATYFINENLKVREDQAIGTSNFLDNERNSMKTRLEAVEEQLKLYREKYMGELPEQLETNLRAMDRLQAQMTERQQSLQVARTTLVSIENSIAEMEKEKEQMETAKAEAGDKSGLAQQMKTQLAELKFKYTDHHPDVIRMKQMIEDVEKNKETKNLSNFRSEREEPRRQIISEQYSNFIYRRNRIVQEIALTEKEIVALQKEIEFYQNRVEKTPKREQELMSLQRDYDNIKKIYSSLLSRKLEAEIAVNMEKRQKGEQFRILDYAKFPQVPVSPNIKKLFLISLAVGFGTGIGIIFLLEQADTSFRSSKAIEEILEIEVLGVFPKIETTKEILTNRANLVATTVAGFFCFTLMAVFILIIVKGADKIANAIGRIL